MELFLSCLLSIVCRYDKTEDLKAGGEHLLKADYLFIGANSATSEELKPYNETHEIFHVEYGYSKVRIDLKKAPFIFFISEPKIHVLRRLK